MRLIGFRGFDWEGSGYFCGLPYGVPFMSAQPTILTRPGTHPTFGPGAVSERAIPAQFGYKGSLASYEEAWNQLLTQLRPLDSRPGELRGERLDGTIVTIQAVLTLPPGVSTGEVNTIAVNFIAVDPLWSAETETSETKTFTRNEDLALHVPITGNIEKAPTITISPTVQRTSGTAGAGFTKRQTLRITNGLSRALINFPYRLDLGDTAALVTASKMQADGDDLRLIYQGREIARTLVGINTTQTYAWIIIPNLPALATMDLDLWYGNAAASAATALSGAAVPPLNLSTSSNTVWKYPIDDVAANAGLGAWQLSSGTTTPVINTDAPGSWRFATLLPSSPDATWQERYTDYTDSGLKYVAKLAAIRARAAAIPAQADYVDADGVMLYHPGGISQVRADFQWRNDYAKGTSGNPVGRVGIYASDSGDNWRAVQEWSTVQNGSLAAIAVANYAVSPAAPYVACATKPYSGTRISTTAKATAQAFVTWDATLEVTVGGGSITQSTVQAEEEIYEVALDARTGGDADLDAPYTVLRIGGDVDSRLAMRLNEKLKIFTASRTAQIWNSAETTKLADVPVYAIDARAKLTADGSEVAAQSWLKMQAYQNPLSNPEFTANLNGWTRVSTGTGVTAARAAVSGRMQQAITPSTGASGINAVIEQADDYLPIGESSVVSVAADFETSNANLVPRLAVWFYNAAQSLIGTFDVESAYTPPTGAVLRRVHQVAVPSTARYYRVGFVVRTGAANATGTVYADKVAPGGNELIIRDAAIGTLAVTVSWLAQYV